MSSNDSIEDGDIDFDLLEYIKDSSELFVIMGVFGALAIYITQLSQSSLADSKLLVQVGFASSFLLSLFMLYLVYTGMAREFGGWLSLYRTHFYLKNIDLIIFTSLNAMLIISISDILLRRESAVILLVYVITYLLTIIMYLKSLFLFTKVKSKSKFYGNLILVMVYGIFFIITDKLFNKYYVPEAVVDIQNLSFSKPILTTYNIGVLTVGTIRSLAAITVLVCTISLLYTFLKGIKNTSMTYLRRLYDY